MNVLLKDERCPKCGKLLGRIDGRAEIKCPRCSEMVNIDNTVFHKNKSDLIATK